MSAVVQPPNKKPLINVPSGINVHEQIFCLEHNDGGWMAEELAVPARGTIEGFICFHTAQEASDYLRPDLYLYNDAERADLKEWNALAVSFQEVFDKMVWHANTGASDPIRAMHILSHQLDKVTESLRFILTNTVLLTTE